jgi:hypothetical protein
MHTNKTSFSRNTALIVVAAVCAFGGFATEAQARNRQTTVTGAGGQTATRDVFRQRGDVSSSTTGPNGKTASRTVDRSATGTTSTIVGANGKTAERVTTRTDTGSQSTVTGPNGQTGSVTVTH